MSVLWVIGYFFSFDEDAWLGLFSILGYLSAPRIECLTLRGSLQRTLAVMMRGSMEMSPSELFLHILSFDEAADTPALDVNPAWHRLHSLRIYLPPLQEMFSRLSAGESSTALNSILSFLAKKCSVHMSTTDSFTYPLGTTEIIHTNYDSYPKYLDTVSGRKNREINEFRPYVADMAMSRGSITWSTFSFTEYATAVDRSLRTAGLMVFYSEMLDPSYARVFADLEYLQCEAADASDAISTFRLLSLRTLHIVGDFWPEDHINTISHCMMKHAEDLSCLTTLVLNTVFPWKPLIDLLGKFNKSNGRGGIKTLRIPSLPHPAIVWEIKAALNSGPEGYETDYVDRDKQEIDDSEWCYECFSGGWVCVGKEWCTRIETEVSITKDTGWRGIDWYSSTLRNHSLYY